MTALDARHKHATNERAADEARADQRRTAIVGLCCAVIGAGFAWVGKGTSLATYVGLVTLCVTPGCAAACWATTGQRLTRVVTVLAASMAWSVLFATVLAWSQITSLALLVAGTAGLGAAGSVVFLVAQRDRPRDRPREHAPENAGRDDRRDDRGWVDPRVRETRWQPALDRRERSPEHAAPAASVKAPLIIGTIALVVAAGLLADSVDRAAGHAVGSYGLLPLLGAPFYLAVILTFGAFALALRYLGPLRPVAWAAMAFVLVELNGVPMMLANTTLSSWTYKHFGVVDLIVHGGALNDPFDIYQQWPGFFAAAAGLVRLSGRSALTDGNWAQLFFSAIDALVLFAIARRFASDRPVVPYITVVLFITANWEGQFYFSPQTTAFTLSLLFMFLLLPWVEPSRLRRFFARRRWLQIPPLTVPDSERLTGPGTIAQLAGLIAMFAAIVVTHQLTPYIVFAGLVVLWVLGVLRNPRIIIPVIVLLAAYPLLHVGAIQQNNVLDGLNLSNLLGKAGDASASSHPGKPAALAGVVAKLIALGIWGGTAVCALSYRRRFGTVLLPVILALVPFSFALVSNYDGEAIYRVFLFSSPWCALVIARRLADLNRLPVLTLAVVACWGIFAGLGSAQAQDFGLFQVTQVPTGEIAAADYFLDHARVNTMLILASANFPSRPDHNYVLHDDQVTQNDLSLDEIPMYEGTGLEHTSPKALARMVTLLGGGVGYLAVSPSMTQYNNYYGILAPGTLPNLVPRLTASAYWTVWYRNGETYILKARPQGRPVKKVTQDRHDHK